MMRILYWIGLFVLGSPVVIFCQQKEPLLSLKNEGIVKIIFVNTIHKQPIVLYDSIYTNPFGETYVVSKLKYYITGFSLFSLGKMTIENEACYLINQAVDSSLQFTFAAPENEYDSIRFLLGVDSSSNTSGAQTGALDPLNDMFWTWNTGYVMFKMEGTSPQSKAINNKMEYHIGGYKANNNVAKNITIHFAKDQVLKIKKGKKSSLVIEANFDEFWQGQSNLKIGETPVCSSPGELAKKIAGHYYNIFTIAQVTNPN
jgi:hypothetical protein